MSFACSPICLVSALFAGALACCAQPPVPQPLVLQSPLVLHSPLQDKEFYLLSLLQADPAVRRDLSSDPALRQISGERQRFAAQALITCEHDAVCMVRALLWTEEEIRAVSLALTRGYQQSASIRELVDHDLRSSGAYVLFEKEDGAVLLANAWEQCAHGLNAILSVYGQGLPPRYPKIDAASVDLHNADFLRGVSTLLRDSQADSTTALFDEPSLRAALALLLLNHRDEAARLEPMDTGVNAGTLRSIPSTDWSRYPYSAIVVPGAGPSDPDTPLSPAGRSRAALAAEAYRAGKAPFILLSGGYVHPSQTRFAEAMEMKKVLLADYQIPERALLVDPHARHTTTNMRNAAREIYRYHMPMEKPALVVSDAAQVAYIAGQPFADRCFKELGYLPYRIIARPSPTSVSFLPQKDSLQQDPLDPLDP